MSWIGVNKGDPENQKIYWVFDSKAVFDTARIRLMRYLASEGWPKGITHYAEKDMIKEPGS